jgi:hypothetical protein
VVFTQTRANILLLEYHADDPVTTCNTLAVLWEALQYRYGAAVAAHSAAWERSKVYCLVCGAFSPMPLLLFIGQRPVPVG